MNDPYNLYRTFIAGKPQEVHRQEWQEIYRYTPYKIYVDGRPHINYHKERVIFLQPELAKEDSDSTLKES